MTKEEYDINEQLLIAKINAAKNELNELQKKYVSEYEFQKGDKVRVTYNQTETIECFIGWVGFEYGHKFCINFNKIKKNGSMSEISAGIYYWRVNKIEKI